MTGTQLSAKGGGGGKNSGQITALGEKIKAWRMAICSRDDLRRIDCKAGNPGG